MRSQHKEAPVSLHKLDQPLVDSLHAEGHKLWKALSVIALDPKIRAYLRENDPKALAQVDEARGTSFEVYDNTEGSVVSTHESDELARSYISDWFGAVPGTPQSRGARYIVRPK